MSTLQVANVHFDSTGANRIEYTGNNVVRVQGKGLVIPRIDTANTPSPEPGMMFYNTSTNNMVMMANTSAVVTIPSNTVVDAAFASINAGYTVANAGFAKANTALQNTNGTVFGGSMGITGSLGIGLASPNFSLTLEGIKPIAEIRSGGYLMLRPTTNDYDYRITSDGYLMKFYAGSDLTNSIMSMNTSKYVGIGYESPSYKLDVSDTSRFGKLLIGEGTYKNSITPIGDNNLNLNTPSGAVYVSNSIRSPIYYDSDNTNYYVDPGATTNMSNLTVTNNLYNPNNYQSDSLGTLSLNGTWPLTGSTFEGNPSTLAYRKKTTHHSAWLTQYDFTVNLGTDGTGNSTQYFYLLHPTGQATWVEMVQIEVWVGWWNWSLQSGYANFLIVAANNTWTTYVISRTGTAVDLLSPRVAINGTTNVKIGLQNLSGRNNFAVRMRSFDDKLGTISGAYYTNTAF